MALLALPVPTTPLRAQESTVDPVAQEALAELAAARPVRRAFRIVEQLDAWSLDRTVELTQIPAPPFLEARRGERFAELLREAGADSVWIDAEGNVLGLRKGVSRHRTIALGGHMDTVFPEGTDVTVRTRGDTLYAPGIGDDTRGLVVVLTVLRALEESGVETREDLLFVGTVGEEGLGDLRGVKHLFRPGADPIHAWIEVDGGGLAPVVSRGLGSVRYRVTFQGPGGHSWRDFGTANPAHALGRSIEYFEAAADTLTHRGPEASFNVGRIGGGTSVNSIPFRTWMEVDMRSESPDRLEQLEETFRGAMAQALEDANARRRQGPPLEVVLDRIGDRPSGALPDDEPLVQRALASALQLGVTPRLVRSSTNSNIPISLGIPAVTIGRGGDGGNAHAPNEWWRNVDGHLAIQRALLLTVSEAGLAGPLNP